jgi:hypothetical protein
MSLYNYNVATPSHNSEILEVKQERHVVLGNPDKSEKIRYL